MSITVLLPALIAGGTILILACAGLPFLIAMQRSQRILATGVRAPAVVESMEDTGVTVNGRPLVSFGLVVRPADGQPYRLVHRQTLPRVPMGVVAPGVTVPVKVDPSRPRRLRIDWACWRPVPR